ncbi:esterase AGAP003155 isoform X1 [Eucalyptus grandis]|uniref:esterase AGAP003155 isoform X1 n=1 Tax=Eucalyptus grandis TaxID=71139 RepID=UPI00192EC904|nr:esterase AGAP003155 isoform X1 [Eucalyptus grandis]
MTESRALEKPRILCLHGFRMSAKILETQMHKWPESLLEKLDLVYLDAPYPSMGKSGAEGVFDPPYFEWFQGNQDYTEYENFKECIDFIEDFMVKNGPFDGLLGFSQGAVLAAALPGMQAEGLVFTKVPEIKFLILISGAKLGGSKFSAPPLAANAFSSPVKCPSLHVIGENDLVKPDSIALLDSFVDPIIVHHLEDHTIPRLDNQSLEDVNNFIDKIQNHATA